MISANRTGRRHHGARERARECRPKSPPGVGKGTGVGRRATRDARGALTTGARRPRARRCPRSRCGGRRGTRACRGARRARSPPRAALARGRTSALSPRFITTHKLRPCHARWISFSVFFLPRVGQIGQNCPRHPTRTFGVSVIAQSKSNGCGLCAKHYRMDHASTSQHLEAASIHN